jgi:2-octaprenylphenol hydroxylase
MSVTFDIVIVGGGVVGMTLACALAQRTSLSIALLEAAPMTHEWLVPMHCHRVSAISLASQRIFQALQVWEAIQGKRVSPFTQIQVWDNDSNRCLSFDCEEIAESVLGFIVENDVIRSALAEKLKQYTQVAIMAPVALQAYQTTKDGVELVLRSGQILRGRLAVAADGANSWLRQQAGILLNQQDYGQKALVTTVQTALFHRQVARQVFYRTSVLAFLPLLDPAVSSIVWSLPAEEAEQVLAYTDSEFKQCLSDRFPVLGEIISVVPRHVFPLRTQQVKHYVQPRMVLAGDAAHLIHPLAGQGMNMGLLDVASLVEVITDAIARREDFSHSHCLRRYERWRKADNFALLVGVDWLKKLFASEARAVQTARSIGLGVVNHMPHIKDMCTRYAVGNRRNLPRLAQK